MRGFGPRQRSSITQAALDHLAATRVTVDVDDGATRTTIEPASKRFRTAGSKYAKGSVAVHANSLYSPGATPRKANRPRSSVVADLNKSSRVRSAGTSTA